MPTAAQEQTLRRYAGARRLCYNWAVARFRAYDAVWRRWSWERWITGSPEPDSPLPLSREWKRPADTAEGGWAHTAYPLARSKSAKGRWVGGVWSGVLDGSPPPKPMRAPRPQPAGVSPRDHVAPWWAEVPATVWEGALRDATDANLRMIKGRKGTGPKSGPPRFQGRGGPARFSLDWAYQQIWADRDHIAIPRGNAVSPADAPAPVRTAERMSSLARLLAAEPRPRRVKGEAVITGGSIYERAGRWHVSILTRRTRPQNPKIAHPTVTAGMDVGVRCWAVIAVPAGLELDLPDPAWEQTDTGDGWTLIRVPNPRALQAELAALRVAQRQMDRRLGGRGQARSSRAYREARRRVSRIHRRVVDVRTAAAHQLTTWLAETFGRVVVEDLSIRGMVQQRGAHGARTRRRELAAAALGTIHSQLRYKAEWSGAVIDTPGRWWPSSKTCRHCGEITDIGMAEHWTCACGALHNRDDNAAINLARYGGSDGAAVAPAGKGTASSSPLPGAPGPAGPGGNPRGTPLIGRETVAPGPCGAGENPPRNRGGIHPSGQAGSHRPRTARSSASGRQNTPPGPRGRAVA